MRLSSEKVIALPREECPRPSPGGSGLKKGWMEESVVSNQRMSSETPGKGESSKFIVVNDWYIFLWVCVYLDCPSFTQGMYKQCIRTQNRTLFPARKDTDLSTDLSEIAQRKKSKVLILFSGCLPVSQIVLLFLQSPHHSVKCQSLINFIWNCLSFFLFTSYPSRPC